MITKWDKKVKRAYKKRASKPVTNFTQVIEEPRVKRKYKKRARKVLSPVKESRLTDLGRVLTGVLDSEETKALRYNEGKLKWSLVNFASLVPMVQVLTFGAAKYAPNNWKKGLDRSEILESMMRHLTALIDGEETDPESKLSHIGHLFCGCMFYSFHFVINKK